jgi:hypothetical protein
VQRRARVSGSMWRGRVIPDRGSFRVAKRPESGRLSSSRNLIGCHKVPSDRASRPLFPAR